MRTLPYDCIIRRSFGLRQTRIASGYLGTANIVEAFLTESVYGKIPAQPFGDSGLFVSGKTDNFSKGIPDCEVRDLGREIA